MVERIKIIGVANSPYTRKMLSILRYKHIPYEVHWGDVAAHLSQLGIEPPRPILLPTVLLKNKENVYEAVTDTTPIIRRLENDYPARNTIPEDPALSFINYLLEDFGDEWVTKYMFHYRWHFEEDADNAGTILPLSHAVNLPEDIHSDFKSIVAKRQIDRLWVVGSSDKTAALIDSSYKRFL
jgi:glutathione S-transferase